MENHDKKKVIKVGREVIEREVETPRSDRPDRHIQLPKYRQNIIHIWPNDQSLITNKAALFSEILRVINFSLSLGSIFNRLVS
jgi:hypothetical protein